MNIFRAIWSILLSNGIFIAIWYIFSCFSKLYRKKSGNPNSVPFANKRTQALGGGIKRVFVKFVRMQCNF
jgi:hypothetical protein